MNKNFRITTDYILQIFNVTTQGYHTIWMGELNGEKYIEVSPEPDTTSIALEWDFIINQFPSPSDFKATTSNYTISDGGVLQLLNPNTNQYYSIDIVFSKNNPIFNIN